MVMGVTETGENRDTDVDISRYSTKASETVSRAKLKHCRASNPQLFLPTTFSGLRVGRASNESRVCVCVSVTFEFNHLNLT